MTKFEELVKKIENGISDLTHLRIQTVMGPLETNDKGEIDFPKQQQIEGIITNIDLIDGDIKTQMTEHFYKTYPELVQFHQSRETKGQDIISKNIEVLKQIVDFIEEKFNK